MRFSDSARFDGPLPVMIDGALEWARSQYIRLRDRTVIEAMASGIPRVRAALEEAGMPAPEFHDQGLRFTAIVHRRRQPARVSAHLIAPTSAQRRVLAQLESGPRTATSVAESLGISPQAVRRTLASLRTAQLIERQGLMYRHRVT